MCCVLLINVHYIEYLARIGDLLELIDTSDDDANVHSTDFTSRVGSISVGVVSTVTSFGWVPCIGLFFVICWFIHSFIRQLIFCRYFVGYSFGTFELSVIVKKMSRYAESNGDFRYVSIKYYFDDLGCASLPNLMDNSYLDTTICHR